MLSNNPLIEGDSYEFALEFSDSSGAQLIQTATPLFNVLVKCTKVVDCSSSIQSDFTYFLAEATTITIPACLITPNFCKNLTEGSVKTNNV